MSTLIPSVREGDDKCKAKQSPELQVNNKHCQYEVCFSLFVLAQSFSKADDLMRYISEDVLLYILYYFK